MKKEISNLKTIAYKEIDKKIALFAIAICVAGFLAAVSGVVRVGPVWFEFPEPLEPEPEIPGLIKVRGIKRFASEQEFKDYLSLGADQLDLWAWQGFGVFNRDVSISMPEMAPLKLEEGIGSGGEPERISETTVQVAGIDEPDIVKTDGKEIYFSSQYYWGWREPRIMSGAEKMIWPPEYENKTKLIKAFPPADLGLDSEIKKSGNLLLSDNILIVFSGQNIYGYDVADAKNPQEKWQAELSNNSYLVDARLYQGSIYLIVQDRINDARPCPIKPLVSEGMELIIGCQEIYHPSIPITADITFVALKLDPVSGNIEERVSFVGSSGSSVVYMSQGAIYATYSYYESIVGFYFDFFVEKCTDIIPASIIQRLEKLESYDISHRAKLTELEFILEDYYNSLDSDERLRIENEAANRMSDYSKEHKRDLEKTGIVKIGLEQFDISASGNVAGKPLNQFALDEYNNHLRIATTVGEFWGWGFGVNESANDVYVLDENLKITGSVKDLGLTERIYSVRFIEDKGYVVTFREIDPFYVLDLSSPQNPQLKGELKIPGYSSYLHPITKDKILGIGKEDWKVKISLFDVSNPLNPQEQNKYILDESWSDVLSTHHAFLLDSKHKIFFLPGSRGGYVFSYENDKLSLKKAISNISAKRAIYLDDYLYIIGDNKIVVLNELDWQKVNELEL